MRTIVDIAYTSGLLALAALAPLAACSSSSGGATPDTDGGSTAHHDAGHSTGSDGGKHADAAQGEGGSGEIIGGVVSFASGGGPDKDAFTIVGAFDEGSGGLGGTSPCEAAVDGCTFCASTVGMTKPGTLQLSFLPAGVLTLKDGQKQLATLDYSNPTDAGGDYEYDSNTHPSLTWASGDTLSVKATGAAVIPAFSGSITAPQEIAGLSPALSLLKAVDVKTTDGLTVTWKDSHEGASMSFVLGYLSKAGGTIGCTADESAGKITVAASLVAKLTGGVAGGGTASLSKTVTQAIPLKGVTVKLQAVAPSVSGSINFTK